MRNRTLLAALLGTAMVVGGADLAMADDVSPLRLSANLMQAEPAAIKGHSVAEGTTFRFRGYGIYSDASGSVKWGDRVPATTSDIDLEDVLGMDMEKFTGGFLIGLNFGSEGRMHLEASYDGYYDYEGDRILGSISIDGEVYTGRVQSELTLHAGMLNFGYDFIRMDQFTLTGNLGVRVFYLDASIREVLTGRDASVALIAPIPTPGLAARYNITENVYVSGSAAGMYFGEYGSYIELSAELGYDINKNVGLFVGYRYWALELNWDDTDFDIDIGGIYAGVEVRI